MPFKKGQSGNPSGRKAAPPDIAISRKLTQVEYERIVNSYLYLTKDELREKTENKKTTLFEHMIGSIIHKAVVEGDSMRAEFLLSRLIPKKVSEEVKTEFLKAPSNLEIMIELLKDPVTRSFVNKMLDNKSDVIAESILVTNSQVLATPRKTD